VIILHLFSDGQAFSFLLSIYLSLYVYMDEQAKEKSDKMFLWSKKTDWKGPEWDIFIEQQNVDDINLLSKGDQNTLVPELSNLNINHNNRAWRGLPLMLATCNAHFPVGSALLCCAKTLLVS
jgi:hypothetical protein